MSAATETTPISRSDLEPLGPDSVAWNVAGDGRLFLGAGRTLLLQVAHPVVAAGVADYSDYKERPWKRLVNTMDLYLPVLFGGERGAIEAGRRLREMHKRIRGVDARGRRYHALEPAAYHWVHATLVDNAFAVHERFGTPLTLTQAERFYAEMRQVGLILGVRERDMPPDWPSFRAYMDEMTATALEDSPVVRDVLESISKPAPPPHVPAWLWRAIRRPPARVMHLGTIGLTPPALRRKLQLPWTAANERELRLYAAIIRLCLRLVPRRLRLAGPNYVAFIEWRRARRRRNLRGRLDPSEAR